MGGGNDDDISMVINLSSPLGKSANDFLDPQKCTLKYSSFDDAVQMIQNLGPNALIGKMDVSNALRSLPVRPQDLSLLVFKAITTLISVCLWAVLYHRLYSRNSPPFCTGH